MRARIAVAAALAVAAATLTGCDWSDKVSEPFHDAKRGETNNHAADVGTMPDGFSNWSTKCDHGNRVYVTYHGDSPYAAIAVVPSDPSCR